jgi:hypothetical protein
MGRGHYPLRRYRGLAILPAPAFPALRAVDVDDAIFDLGDVDFNKAAILAVKRVSRVLQEVTPSASNRYIRREATIAMRLINRTHLNPA